MVKLATNPAVIFFRTRSSSIKSDIYSIYTYIYSDYAKCCHQSHLRFAAGSWILLIKVWFKLRLVDPVIDWERRQARPVGVSVLREVCQVVLQRLRERGVGNRSAYVCVAGVGTLRVWVPGGH